MKNEHNELIVGAVIAIFIVLTVAIGTGYSGAATQVIFNNKADAEIRPGTQLSDPQAFGDGGIQDNDLAQMWDGEITINTNDVKKRYDTHEKIGFYGAAVHTSLSYAGEESEDFDDNVFIAARNKEVKYQYIFDDSLDPANFITEASEDDPVFLNVLGHNLKITSATANSITAVGGAYGELHPGESMKAGNQILTVLGVDSNSVQVNLGGSQAWIDEGSSGAVGGLDVYVDAVHDIEGTTSNDTAELYVGGVNADAKLTYKNNDPFIGEDARYSAWRWELSGLGSSRPSINVTLAQNLDDSDGVIYPGDALIFPNNFAKIEFSAPIASWRTYELSTSSEDLYATTDAAAPTVSGAKVLHWSCVDLCGGDDAFSLNGIGSDNVYAYQNAGGGLDIYYYDSQSGKVVLAKSMAGSGDAFLIVHQNTRLPVAVTMLSPAYVWTLSEHSSFGGDGNEIDYYTMISAPNEFTYLGSTDGSASANNVVYGGTDISYWERNTMTDAGVKVHDPESGARSGWTFEVPDDLNNFKAEVTVIGKLNTIS